MPTTEEVPAEPRVQPKIAQILEVLRPGGAIDDAAKIQAEGMSAMGAIYKKVEKDMNGNRGAVAMIRKLDKMSADKRADYIRTLEPLLVERGYTLDAIDPDLADQAEKNDDTGDAGPGTNGTTNALDAARAHMAGGNDPVDHDQFVKDAAAAKKGKPKLGIVTPSSETKQ